VTSVALVASAQTVAAAEQAGPSVPVLSGIPVAGRLFVVEPPRPAVGRGVPVLTNIPFVGRLYAVELGGRTEPGAVPVLSTIPIMGRLFR